MARYMKDQFAFFGVPSPRRRAIQREVLGRWRPGSAEQLAEFATALWAVPQREAQYVATDVLAGNSALANLALAETLIVVKSWWDTVDGIAPVVGALVARDPATAVAMDDWIVGRNMWKARVALIHQLRFRERTDVERLFRYCALRAGDREFFIRKAIGWALRQYARTDPSAVRAFVAAHPELSGLSRREALRHLGE